MYSWQCQTMPSPLLHFYGEQNKLLGLIKQFQYQVPNAFQPIASFEISDSMQEGKFSYEKRFVRVHKEYASHFFSFCLIFLSNSQTGSAVIPPIMPARKLGIGILNKYLQNKPTIKLATNIAITVIANLCQKAMFTSNSLTIFKQKDKIFFNMTFYQKSLP